MVTTPDKIPRENNRMPSVLNQTLMDFVGCIPTACIVVDEFGRIVDVNSPGDKLLRKGDGIRAHRGQLVATGSQKLQKLIAEASKSGAGPIATSIRRASLRPLLVRAIFIAPEA